MRKNPVLVVLALATFALSLAGCGGEDEAVSFSAPVGINLKVASGDVGADGVMQHDKNITTESGNPYGAFVTSARLELDGRDPGRIEVVGMELTLGGQSKNVTSLEQVFQGNVTVLFVTNDTNTTFVAGEIADPVGAGPAAMTVRFDANAVTVVDFAKLLSGSFKVVIRGTAAPGFDTRDAEADLQVVITFAAYAE